MVSYFIRGFILTLYAAHGCHITPASVALTSAVPWTTQFVAIITEKYASHTALDVCLRTRRRNNSSVYGNRYLGTKNRYKVNK